MIVFKVRTLFCPVTKSPDPTDDKNPINYKPLNSVLEWIRYPIPNKRDLINRLNDSVIFSKFDMKSGFWQIQISEEDKYKTAFVTPFGHYEWNVMPFGLTNAGATYERDTTTLLYGLIHKEVEVYVDDMIIKSRTQYGHVPDL